MSLKERSEILEYLKTDGCNQVRGFYDFSGYWQNKDEAVASLSEERKQNLKSIWGEMISITEKEIEEEIISYSNDWLKKYGNVGRSNNEKQMKQNILNASSLAKENFKILSRTRFFVGCSIGYFNEEEVKEMIKNVKEDELNSTFWKNREDTRLSNCIFRLNILKSYLEKSPYEKDIKAEIKEISVKRLELNGVKEDFKIGNLSLKEISELMKNIKDC